MNRAIVITGGAGFIGCALARGLGESGLPIVVVDNLHPQIHPNQECPKALPDFVNFVRGDVTERSTWDQILAHWTPSIVVHLAAETGTGQSLTEASRHAKVNVVGTTAMLDAFTRYAVKPEHIVLSSSRAIYGEGAWSDESGKLFYPAPRSHAVLAAGKWDPRPPSGKGAAMPLAHACGKVTPAPTSIYGATKLAQEHILGAWCAAMQVPLSIFRLQNVYGPGQSPYNAYTGIITLFIRQARMGKVLDVYEDGRIGRDFVFIDDVVSALSAGIANPPTERRLLDVGHGVVTTIYEAACIIAKQQAAPTPVVTGKYRDGDVRWAVADIEPLAQELNVRPAVGFGEGVQRVAEWLVKRGYV